jgi:hypothetical protein
MAVLLIVFKRQQVGQEAQLAWEVMVLTLVQLLVAVVAADLLHLGVMAVMHQNRMFSQQ